MSALTRSPIRGDHTQTSERVLVVADETCTRPDICAGIQTDAQGPIDVLVLVPAHGSPGAQWTVDEEDAVDDATRRLQAFVACLAQAGVDARAQIADPDPVQAIADALHEYPADQIVIFTGAARWSSWLHQNVIDRARRRFHQPIEHVVVGPPD